MPFPGAQKCVESNSGRSADARKEFQGGDGHADLLQSTVRGQPAPRGWKPRLLFFSPTHPRAANRERKSKRHIVVGMDDLRLLGNAAFKSGDFAKAVDLYTLALREQGGATRRAYGHGEANGCSAEGGTVGDGGEGRGRGRNREGEERG